QIGPHADLAAHFLQRTVEIDSHIDIGIRLRTSETRAPARHRNAISDPQSTLILSKHQQRKSAPALRGGIGRVANRHIQFEDVPLLCVERRQQGRGEYQCRAHGEPTSSASTTYYQRPSLKVYLN